MALPAVVLIISFWLLFWSCFTMACVGSMEARLGGCWCLAHSGRTSYTKGSAPTDDRSIRQHAIQQGQLHGGTATTLHEVSTQQAAEGCFSPQRLVLHISSKSCAVPPLPCVAVQRAAWLPARTRMEKRQPLSQYTCTVLMTCSLDHLLDVKAAALSVRF